MTDLKTFGIDKEAGKLHEEIIYSLALIFNIVDNRITNYLKDYSLTTGKLNILIAVKHQGGEKGIPQVQISKHLIVTPSNMTKMIDKLEKEGMVTRSALEGDRRVNIVNITKKGSDLLDSVWEGYNSQLKEQINYLPKDKQKQLASLLVEWFEKIQ